MTYPAKVICEMTGKGYVIIVLDTDGKELFRNEHFMESAGSSRSDGSEVFECDALQEFDKLQEEIDDGLCFGPFGISGELYNILELHTNDH